MFQYANLFAVHAVYMGRLSGSWRAALPSSARVHFVPHLSHKHNNASVR